MFYHGIYAYETLENIIFENHQEHGEHRVLHILSVLGVFRVLRVLRFSLFSVFSVISASSLIFEYDIFQSFICIYSMFPVVKVVRISWYVVKLSYNNTN